MITLTEAEKALLMRVLEIGPDEGRKGGVRLRPLSMYSSELKSAKHTASVAKSIAAGEEHGPSELSRDRYSNTLDNIGFWAGTPEGGSISAAGRKLIALAEEGDGSAAFWRRQSRAVDRIFFEYQLSRLMGGETEQSGVSTVWREIFRNTQDVVDRVDNGLLRHALTESDLKTLEVLQYINSVGTETWRFGRLDVSERVAFEDLILRLRPAFLKDQDAAGDKALETAIAYASVISTYQRDVKYRVAGFLEAFLDIKAEMGEDFPRMSPDLKPYRSLAAAATLGRPARGDGSAKPPSLTLPRQLVISGCPGSGKSFLAETAARGARIVRTQFHAETTSSAFIGSFRPSPVYEEADGVLDPNGDPFTQGRPLIDYRFVPGPALNALALAFADPTQNVVLLIEELNRGNAAAIFGELFQLLDRGADGASRYGVELPAEATQWLRAKGAVDAEGKVRFPANLYIWATMNSGDQGVFPLDTAFRRRWSYRYLGYSEPCGYAIADRKVRFAGRDLNWDGLRRAINKHLKSLGVQEDRLIGPYFLTPEQLRSPDELQSKLLLYLWDDVLRFHQDRLFGGASSFAEVTALWNGGEGNPFGAGMIDLEGADWVGEEDPAPSEDEVAEAADTQEPRDDPALMSGEGASAPEEDDAVGTADEPRTDSPAAGAAEAEA